jgi:hypothetical protein
MEGTSHRTGKIRVFSPFFRKFPAYNRAGIFTGYFIGTDFWLVATG